MDQISAPFPRSPSMVNFKQSLTIRHLRLISTLARELNVSRCADMLHTSQSAVSRGLTEIEDILGVRLFDRSTRRVTITPPGQSLIWHADQILGQLDQAQADFSAFALGGGELKVGVMGGVSPTLLHHATELAREHAPTLKVRLYCDVAEALMTDFTNGRFNLMLTHFDTRKLVQDDLIINVLYEEQIGILCAPTHRLAGLKRVRWQDLAHEHWAITPAETAPRRIIEREIMVHTGNKMRIVMETKEAHYIIASLQSGNVLGALPLHVAQWYAQFGAANLLKIEEETMFTVCAVHRRSKTLTPTESLFLNCLKQASRHSTGQVEEPLAQAVSC